MSLPSPDPLALAPLLDDGPVLLAGPSGGGKTTLLDALADAVGGALALTADPGRPAFGPPAAVHVAARRNGHWALRRSEALCTLDAARFRLPLLRAVARLVGAVERRPVLVDAPGVARGTFAVELLEALVEIAAIRTVLWIGAEPPPFVLPAARVRHVPPSSGARPLEPARRVAVRTAAWDAHVATAPVTPLPDLPRLGAPPADGALGGRLAAVLDDDLATLTLGEIVATPEGLGLRAPPFDPSRARFLLVRDAERAPTGVRTAPAARPAPPVQARDPAAPLPLPAPGTDAESRIPATLLGGLLGDPTLLLRPTGTGRAILVDVGDQPALRTSLAHKVDLLLVTHAHADHFGGFTTLLRRRIGLVAPVTVLGPPDLADRVEAAAGSLTWDRIGEEGPAFRVGEIRGDHVVWSLVRAGGRRVPDGEDPVVDGVVHRDRDVRVRAAVLDHGTPVVAWSIEEPPRRHVRPDALAATGLRPGPWVGELLGQLAAGRPDARIGLPDGTEATARSLEERLTKARRGRRLVFATDLGDTPSNREALTALARGADLLVCEATFLEEDAPRARATGHLTARAAGEIAAAADVGLLVPFHFSARYAERLPEVLGEVRRAFERVWAPSWAE